MCNLSTCTHHWVVGDLIKVYDDLDIAKVPGRGRLRYRESVCKLCGEVKALKERETDYISRIEIESL